jgi:hypothetical protein
MASLTGTQIANTYKQLLQVGSGNVGLGGTLQTVQDGDATNSPLQLSDSAVNINGTFQLSGVTLTASASTLNAVADLTGATGIVAVSGSNVYGRSLVAGTGITIGNADGTEGDPTIALSTTGITVSLAGIKATSATFADTVSAAFFVGDGSGLTNVPSAEGGTMKFITAGTGINFTVNGVTSATIPVSGTVNINTNQSFGIVSATNIDADELLMAGVSAANVTEVAAVSVLTKTNLDAITSINAVIGDGSGFATDAELAAVSATLATSINNSNTRITSVSDFAVALSATMATSIGTANTRITSVSDFAVALSATLATSIGNSNTNITTNTNAITSINAVIGDGSGFATDAELAAVSATMATSIGNSNTRITSVSDYAVALSATMATSIGTANTRITSVSDYAVALSATMATSIATRLPLAGGTLTGIVSGTDFYVSAVAIGVDTLLGKQLHIGTAAVADIVSLTDGATIAVDFNTGQNFAVQLGGNRTLGNPTNCVPGQTGSAFIIQDGTGGRTLSYGANWEFAGGTAPTLSTAAAAVDRLDYIVYTSTGVHAIATLDVK